MFETNTPLNSDSFTSESGATVAKALEIHSLLNNKDTLMAFTGYFDHLLTTLLLINIKNRLSNAEMLSGVEKKVYSVLVECIENVSKHNIPGNNIRNISTLLISKSDTKYTIVTGNEITNEEVPLLKERLERVAGSTLQELKQSYREQILSKRTDDNNAGLGILDIAIKTGNQIKYQFKPINESTTFYLFQTEITIQK
ncbi:MAG: SiaB family protein kinase [Bacteroidia bacterium]|jgi:hypothetical protein